MSGRPLRGLSPEDALRRYSDPRALQAADEYADAKTDVSVAVGHDPTPAVLRHEEWKRRRGPLEEALDDKLQTGELIASGIPEFGDRREVIHFSLWALVWIDYSFSEIVGGGRRYRCAEIFDRNTIPLNLDHAPAWAMRAAEFSADAGYRHVTLRGSRITLGRKQAEIIKALHEASAGDDPWRAGAELLARAGSRSEHLREVMKDKMALIELDGRGLYRLNVSSGATFQI